MSLFRKMLRIFAALGTLLVVPAAAQAEVYQSYLNGPCFTFAVCNIEFPKVPAGRLLTITNLSCYLRSRDPIYGAQLLLVNSTGAVTFAATPALVLQNKVYAETGDTYQSNVYVSNDTMLAVAKPGEHFRAYAEVRRGGYVWTVAQFACHISGTLTP